MTTETYQYATDKPDAKLVNYNTVRAPELKAVYTSLEESPPGAVTVRKLKSQFTLDDDDHLEQCIRFLHALDFIERPEDRVVTPINEGVFPNLSFEAKCLHHLRQQKRPQDHMAKAQDVAIDKAPRTLERELLVTYLERDLEYITWNKTKVNMWYRLYQGLGAFTYIDSREIVLSPARALLYELLEGFVKTEDSTDFGEAVIWIEQNFISILADRPGTAQLHQGVTDTLQNLIDDGYVEVQGMADAQNEVKLPPTHSRTETPKIKTFTLNEFPSDPATSYRYPLTKFAEVSQ